MMQRWKRRSIIQKQKAASGPATPRSWRLWTTDDVNSFLAANVTDFSDKHANVLYKNEVLGEDLLLLTAADLERWGLPGGVAKRIWRAMVQLVAPEAGKLLDNGFLCLSGELCNPGLQYKASQEALVKLTQSVVRDLVVLQKQQHAAQPPPNTPPRSAGDGRVSPPLLPPEDEIIPTTKTAATTSSFKEFTSTTAAESSATKVEGLDIMAALKSLQRDGLEASFSPSSADGSSSVEFAGASTSPTESSHITTSSPPALTVALQDGEADLLGLMDAAPVRPIVSRATVDSDDSDDDGGVGEGFGLLQSPTCSNAQPRRMSRTLRQGKYQSPGTVLSRPKPKPSSFVPSVRIGNETATLRPVVAEFGSGASSSS